MIQFSSVQFSSVQSLSHVRLFATPWIAAHQASLFITISRSSLRLMSTESVMPSSHLILCRPLLLLPPIPPSIRVFSSESTLLMRCPKYWSFSFSNLVNIIEKFLIIELILKFSVWEKWKNVNSRTSDGDKCYGRKKQVKGAKKNTMGVKWVSEMKLLLNMHVN